MCGGLILVGVGYRLHHRDRSAVITTIEPVGSGWMNQAHRRMRDAKDQSHWPALVLTHPGHDWAEPVDDCDDN